MQEKAFCPGLHTGSCLGGTGDKQRARAKRYPIARARHMEEWAGLLRQAFIAGGLLDLHEGHVCPLGACRDGRCQAGWARLRAFVTGRRSRYHGSGARYPWPEEILGEERRYRTAGERSLDSRGADWCAEWVRQETARESRRLVRAFSHLRPEEAETTDEEYEALLLQYLRVKTALFGLLIHGPGKRGLKRFVEHFQQIKVYAPEADRMKPRAPDEPAGLQVRATEYRVAPDAWFKTHRLRDGEIEERSNAKERPESAWLVHFKRAGADPKSGLPLFGGAIRKLDSEADDICRALTAKRTHLRTLRGVDVCGVEEDQPLWVSADTLRRVRRHSRNVAGGRPALRLEPLRLTVHVGEDFRSLTSGMRAVAEPFHWKLIERGDRIGHGLALTLDPGKWFDRHRGEVLIVKRFDRLLDLAFLAVYAKKEKHNARQRKWLRKQITDMVTSIGFEPESSMKSDEDVVETTKKLWKSLGCRSTRRLLTTDRFPDGERHERWMHSYLWHRSVQKRANHEVRIPVVDDVNDIGGIGEEAGRECTP